MPEANLERGERSGHATSHQWPVYQQYSASEVDWISEIPAHWGVVALKRVAPFVSRGSAPEYAEDETGLPVINQACVYWDGLRLDRVKYDRSPRPARTRKGYVQQGDVLVNSTGTGTLGRAAVFNETGEHIADTHVTIVRLDRTQSEPRYLAYLLATPIYQGFIYTALVSGSTNQIELSREDLRAAPTILPPLDEQRAIAAFLDRETAKIDALIEKKLILLKKLKEWEQRTLFDAVNFEAEKAAECWPVLSIVKPGKPVMYGIVLPGAHVPNGVPIIKGGDVEAGRLEPSLLSRTEVSIDARHSKSKVAEGDLIYAIRGSVGACRVVPSDLSGANLTQDVARISPGRDVTTEWVYLCLRSYFTFGQVEPRILGATIKGINIRDLERVRIPVPSIARQREVADRVGRELRARQQLNDRLRAQITHLREYRTALISAAVTGQIDVRRRV